jgi:hypothetical protein
MLGRRKFKEKEKLKELYKHETSSLSTEESLSPKNQCGTKEKSELCRKFM